MVKRSLTSLALAVLAIGWCCSYAANAQTNRNLPLRNAGSTIPTAPIKRAPVQKKPTVIISQPTQEQLIQYETERNLRAQGLPRIPNPRNPLQWRDYYRASDQAKKKVLGPRYIPPTRKERIIRRIGTGLGVLNSVGPVKKTNPINTIKRK